MYPKNEYSGVPARLPLADAAPEFTRSIEIANRHPRLALDAAGLRRAIAALDAARDRFRGGCPGGELSLVFVTDEALARLHGDFLDDPTTTDVITFAALPGTGLTGEICVSADAAAIYSLKHRRPFATELLLYIVHGWLHLAGYDDLRPDLKRAMRRAEKRAMDVIASTTGTPKFVLRSPRRKPKDGRRS